jgi:hypothetical protein
MRNEMSLTNISFNFLKGSSDFLNVILNNINSCVLILDKEMKLVAFNDVLKTIFSNRKGENLIYRKCGEAIGCAYQIEEEKECGNTSQCCDCELRISALTSYMNSEIIFKDCISRPFFDHHNQKVNKHLQFSTRLFMFENEKYIIMIVEDVTKFIELELKYAKNVN